MFESLAKVAVHHPDAGCRSLLAAAHAACIARAAAFPAQALCSLLRPSGLASDASVSVRLLSALCGISVTGGAGLLKFAGIVQSAAPEEADPQTIFQGAVTLVTDAISLAEQLAAILADPATHPGTVAQLSSSGRYGPEQVLEVFRQALAALHVLEEDPRGAQQQAALLAI